jgi:hypothetical protein
MVNLRRGIRQKKKRRMVRGDALVAKIFDIVAKAAFISDEDALGSAFAEDREIRRPMSWLESLTHRHQWGQWAIAYERAGGVFIPSHLQRICYSCGKQDRDSSQAIAPRSTPAAPLAEARNELKKMPEHLPPEPRLEVGRRPSTRPRALAGLFAITFAAGSAYAGYRLFRRTKGSLPAHPSEPGLPHPAATWPPAPPLAPGQSVSPLPLQQPPRPAKGVKVAGAARLVRRVRPRRQPAARAPQPPPH